MGSTKEFFRRLSIREKPVIRGIVYARDGKTPIGYIGNEVMGEYAVQVQFPTPLVVSAVEERLKKEEEEHPYREIKRSKFFINDNGQLEELEN